MKNVCAEFSIDKSKTTNVLSPDINQDDWGKFSHPECEYWGVFSLDDSEGQIELVVKDWGEFEIKVCAEVPDDVIDSPDPNNIEHQKLIRRFWIRALTVLNTFLIRYRVRTFDYQNQAIKWETTNIHPTGSFIRLGLSIESSSEITQRWTVEGVQSDQPEKVEIEILKGRESGKSWKVYRYKYDQETLDALYDDLNKSIKGVEPGGPVYYETALELLMQAQEIVTREEAQKIEALPAAICAALVTTASACEVFIKGFIEAYGNDLHKFIAKGRSFRVVDLLNYVLTDLPGVGTALSAENPELNNNITLLFNARNRSSHRGRPEVNIRNRDCKIHGWMIYDESLDEDEFGFFTWDVLALIGWLRSKVGEGFIKPAILTYWDEQKTLPVKTREQKIYDLEISGSDWPKPTWTDPYL